MSSGRPGMSGWWSWVSFWRLGGGGETEDMDVVVVFNECWVFYLWWKYMAED